MQGYFLTIVNYQSMQVVEKIDIGGELLLFKPVYASLFKLSKNQYVMISETMSSYYLITLNPFKVMKITLT